MNEFTALDKKIIKGEANDEEEKQFEVLAEGYARSQVKRFDLSTVEQQQLFDKNWNQKAEGHIENIKNSQDFILRQAYEYSIPIEYIWSKIRGPFAAVLCRVPKIKASQFKYRIFVREIHNE